MTVHQHCPQSFLSWWYEKKFFNEQREIVYYYAYR